MISSINVYKSKFIMLIEDLQQSNLNNFPNMSDHLQKHQNCNYNIEKYVAEIKKVIDDFEIRFHDFEKI